MPEEQRKLKLWLLGEITWREILGKKTEVFSSHCVQMWDIS